MPQKTTFADQAALIAEKYVEMRPAVLGYIVRRIDNPEDAEDICQEIFTRLLEYDSILTDYSLPNFIFRSARNLVVDYYRRHALSEKAKEYFSGHTRTSSFCTDEMVALDEMKERERRCVLKMGEWKGRIYMMYIHKGMTSREISDALNLSRRTVENHIFATRNMIRKELGRAL